MSDKSQKWLCCQLGAREHYAVARALQSRRLLTSLITDAWVPSGSVFGKLRRSLRERFHAGLGDADVRSANCGLLGFELGARLLRLDGWNRVMARNRWFQQQAVEKLKTEKLKTERPTVFAYSYAALEIFRWAKARGWRTVLGQIDPGPEMGRIIGELEAEGGVRSGTGVSPVRTETHGRDARATIRAYGPPEEYWRLWREECALADCIVVNSSWSRDCLVREKIPAGKISVVPLAYETPLSARDFKRTSPEQFTAGRPLQLLFLGQVSYLKGIIPLLEAMEQLRESPVELTVVGAELCEIPASLRTLVNVRWIGPVSRGATAEFYQQADVFMFPSYCDGFGLTQLEAQAWRLPVIASRHCGDVVEDGVNGVQLPEVSSAAIARVLKELANDPERVRRLSAGSHVDSKFSLDALAAALAGL